MLGGRKGINFDSFSSAGLFSSAEIRGRFYLRLLPLGTDQPVPTPARCRARQARPASMRLVGEKTALVAVEVALSRKAIMKRTAAMKPSMAADSRS
jgi:hypothetical protein